jgi:RecJ-like exonuclease
VYQNGGIFTKTGGTITGYASDQVNGNVAKNNSGVVQNDRGHAVNVEGTSRRRETTAGPTVNLDSRVDGSAGGWDN